MDIFITFNNSMYSTSLALFLGYTTCTPSDKSWSGGLGTRLVLCFTIYDDLLQVDVVVHGATVIHPDVVRPMRSFVFFSRTYA